MTWTRSLLPPPGTRPAIIGPPLMISEGMLSRAAISIPGTILSQFGTMTTPSRAWALTIISTV